MRYAIDSSSRSHLAICKTCGYRSIEFSLEAARRDLEAHQARAHPGDSEALRANFARARTLSGVSDSFSDSDKRRS